MNYSPQLTIGPFVDAALMWKPPHEAPLASCWGGRLAALWNMEAEVSYQEFMSMTIYRMPLRLVEPAAIQQMKGLEAELHLLAAGWILEEEHDPSVAYYLGRDRRLADVW